ncbi:tetratricopeptide repeat protein [Streptomyces sp. AS02]|nr:tetratricopeptide repeat protein [Streptomyces sp. AS02]MCL8013436.1 tetratricopeptide repeat protein [Streptomyces sp. AS02]
MTLAQCEQELGSRDLLTLRLRNNLADAYQSVGDLDRAIPLFQRALDERQRLLGDTHPDTLQSCTNLAHAYQAAGDLGRAIPLYEATLAQCEEMLGRTHPQTLAGRNQLAQAYEAALAVQQRSTATTMTEADLQGPSTAD